MPTDHHPSTISPSLSSQNLSHYLEFEEHEYHDVLLALGFAKLRRGKIQMQRNTWEDLVATLDVSCPILAENKWHTLCKGMLWIRLGCFLKNGEVYKPGKEPSTVRKVTFTVFEQHKLLGGEETALSAITRKYYMQKKSY